MRFSEFAMSLIPSIIILVACVPAGGDIGEGAGRAAGAYLIPASAFRVESGWQNQAGWLVSAAPGRAACSIVLPPGRYAVWVQATGSIEVALGEQRFNLEREGAAGWERAGSVDGGQIAIAASAFGEGAELRGMAFSSVPGYSPIPVREAAPAREDGLALWLDFDGSDPLVCRDGAVGNDARATSRVGRVMGAWGGALRCSGHGLSVEDAPTLSATEALSVAAWVWPDSMQGYRTILFKGRRSGGLQAVHFDLDLFDGKVEFKYKDAAGAWRGIMRSGPYSVPAIAAREWSHVAATFDAGMVRLYVNGEQVASRESESNRLVPNRRPLLVGEAQSSNGSRAYAFAGLLDDVKIHTRVLSAEEIAAEYEAGRASRPAGVTAMVNPDDARIDRNFERKLRIVEQYERDIPADTIGAQRTTASIRPHQGVPALHINGEPVFPMAMISRGHFPRDVCRDFAAAGVHIYSHIIWNWTPGFLTKDVDWWLGPGEYDFGKVDRQILSIIEADPQAYIFLRLKLNPPAWWLKANPDELSQFEDGRPAEQHSLASEVWEETYERMLRDLLAHIEGSEYAGHIIGYQPAGGSSSEWFWWGYNKDLIDYSPAARRRFRTWLKQRYGEDTEALQKAWADPEVRFESADPPGKEAREASEHMLFRDDTKAGQVIDFLRFLNDMTTHNIIRSCRICKEETGGKKITGVFYGYSAHCVSGRLMLWNQGWMGLKPVLDSPDVDFLCAPTTYGHRRGGESGNFISAYTASYMLHNKLYWDEADLRTHLYRGGEAYACQSAAETLAVMERTFGYALTKGTALWWFTLAGDHTFHDDDMMESIARMAEVGDISLPDEKARIRDVAVFVDEETLFHMRMGVGELLGPLIGDMRRKLAAVGAPHDMYLLSDIADERMPDYKLYIFLNPFYLSDAMREAIETKVRRNNATSVWFYAPGFITEDGAFSEEAMHDLTGIRIRHKAEERELELSVTDFDHPITSELRTADAFEPTGKLGPIFRADDPEALVLGTLNPDGAAGLVVRDFGDWRSVYCASPTMPTGVLRGLIRYAGGHVYSTSDDPFFANHRYVMIHTATVGKKRITLPEARDVYDVLGGETIGRAIRSFEIELPGGVTRIYRLATPGEG